MYNFNGVIISRNKVLRNFETLLKEPDLIIDHSTLFYVLTLNSMLDEQEYNKITVCLNDLIKKRRGLS